MQRSRSTFAVVLGSALVVAVLGWSLLADIGTSLLVGVNDDAGYYLRIARNELIGHPRTFDWIHPTNGFNPLLKSLETAAFRLVDARDRDQCYRIGIGITYLFALLSLGLFVWIVRRLLSWLELPELPLRLLEGLACFFLAWILLKEYYGLDAFPALFFQLALVAVHISGWKRRSWLRYGALGCLALLAALARLDGLSFAAAFGVYFGLQVALGRLPARCVLAFVIPLGLGICAYMAANHREFGVLLPVSAQLKNSFPHPDIVTAFRTVVFTSSRLPNSLVFYASLAAGFAYCLVFSRGMLDGRHRRTVDRWWDLVLPLSVYALGHTLFFSLFSRFDFQATYILFLNVYLLFVAVHALRKSGPLERFDRRRACRAAGGLLLAAAVGVFGIRVARIARVAAEDQFDDRDLGRAIEALTTPEDVIFGEHYGLVAYFTDRAFIGGDGVVNSIDYVRERRARGAALAAYFERQRVTCVFGSRGDRGFETGLEPMRIVGEWKDTCWGEVQLGRRAPSTRSR